MLVLNFPGQFLKKSDMHHVRIQYMEAITTTTNSLEQQRSNTKLKELKYRSGKLDLTARGLQNFWKMYPGLQDLSVNIPATISVSQQLKELKLNRPQSRVNSFPVYV